MNKPNETKKTKDSLVILGKPSKPNKAEEVKELLIIDTNMPRSLLREALSKATHLLARYQNMDDEQLLGMSIQEIQLDLVKLERAQAALRVLHAQLISEFTAIKKKLEEQEAAVILEADKDTSRKWTEALRKAHAKAVVLANPNSARMDKIRLAAEEVQGVYEGAEKLANALKRRLPQPTQAEVM